MTYTTIIAADYEHLSELRLAMPTWKKNRPDMWQNPMICFCDGVEAEGWWSRQFRQFCDHPNLKMVSVPHTSRVTQRHRMLSAFVYGVAEHVQTEHFLKIDSDCACMWNHPSWMPDEWIQPDVQFVSSKWGYTRPPKLFHDCCEWAKGIEAFNGTPEAPGQLDESKNRVNHGRIISYVLLGRTDYMHRLRELAPGPLMPCGSQDTFLWYVATRLGLKYIRTKFSEWGFAHNRRKLAVRCQAAMEVVA